MANADRPRGFVPVGHLTGGEIRARRYLASEDSDTIGRGDAVTLDENGKVDLANAALLPILGIAAEGAATLEGKYILVYDDPMILYEVQTVTGVTTSAAYRGEYASVNHTAANTTTLISQQELADIETDDQSNSQFQIIDLVDRPDNAWGEHSKVIVKINLHQLTSQWSQTT